MVLRMQHSECSRVKGLRRNVHKGVHSLGMGGGEREGGVGMGMGGGEVSLKVFFLPFMKVQFEAQGSFVGVFILHVFYYFV